MRVGLTGGIASGKSVAGRRFQELGITVLNYDQLAREVVAPGTPGLAAVVEAFGQRALSPDGGLDRAALAETVFSDDGARSKLESIVHPLVIAEGQRLDLVAEGRGEKLIVHDIPLLVEAVGPEAFDAVIVVDAPPQLRVSRLVEGRGMTEAEAWSRIDAQSDDEVRRAAGDIIFDGSGTVENLHRQVDQWLAEIRRQGFSYRPPNERTAFLVTEDGLA